MSEHSEKWVEKEGHVAKDPILGMRGLPQGCPLSPLRLCGLITIWAVSMHEIGPSVDLAAYVDDRIMWQRLGPGGDFE